MNLEFPFMTSSVKLNEKDLLFFYYEVATESIDNLIKVVNISDYNIKTYIDKNKIIITSIKEDDELLLDALDYNCNQIIFKCKDNESEVKALIRHLRNAFAHCRIYKSGNKYFIKDIDYMKKGKKPNDITMLAYIEDELLHELVRLITYNKEELNNKIKL